MGEKGTTEIMGASLVTVIWQMTNPVDKFGRFVGFTDSVSFGEERAALRFESPYITYEHDLCARSRHCGSSGYADALAAVLRNRGSDSLGKKQH